MMSSGNQGGGGMTKEPVLNAWGSSEPVYQAWFMSFSFVTL